MRFVKGNLLEATEPVIMHGCNAQGVMGSGVAKYVREKWPEAYEDYKEFCSTTENSAELVGYNHYFDVSNDSGAKVLINAITQNTFGEGKQARYTAILECVDQADLDCDDLTDDEGILHIAIPLIGCGLGGLKWEILKELLDEFEERHPVEFTVYEL